MVHWFHETPLGLLVGFGIIFAIAGLTAQQHPDRLLDATDVGQPRVRLFLSDPVLAQRVPGMLLLCIALTSARCGPVEPRN